MLPRRRSGDTGGTEPDSQQKQKSKKSKKRVKKKQQPTDQQEQQKGRRRKRKTVIVDGPHVTVVETVGGGLSEVGTVAHKDETAALRHATKAGRGVTVVWAGDLDARVLGEGERTYGTGGEARRRSADRLGDTFTRDSWCCEVGTIGVALPEQGVKLAQRARKVVPVALSTGTEDGLWIHVGHHRTCLTARHDGHAVRFVMLRALNEAGSGLAAFDHAVSTADADTLISNTIADLRNRMLSEIGGELDNWRKTNAPELVALKRDAWLHGPGAEIPELADEITALHGFAAQKVSSPVPADKEEALREHRYTVSPATLTDDDTPGMFRPTAVFKEVSRKRTTKRVIIGAGVAVALGLLLGWAYRDGQQLASEIAAAEDTVSGEEQRLAAVVGSSDTAVFDDWRAAQTLVGCPQPDSSTPVLPSPETDVDTALGFGPAPLVWPSGDTWFGYDASTPGGIESVDPSTWPWETVGNGLCRQRRIDLVALLDLTPAVTRLTDLHTRSALDTMFGGNRLYQWELSSGGSTAADADTLAVSSHTFIWAFNGHLVGEWPACFDVSSQWLELGAVAVAVATPTVQSVAPGYRVVEVPADDIRSFEVTPGEGCRIPVSLQAEVDVPDDGGEDGQP